MAIIEFLIDNASYFPFWVVTIIYFYIVGTTFNDKKDEAMATVTMAAPFALGAFMFSSVMFAGITCLFVFLGMMIHAKESDNFTGVLVLLLIITCGIAASAQTSTATLHQSFNDVKELYTPNYLECKVLRIKGSRVLIERTISVKHKHSDAALKVLIDDNSYNVTAVIDNGVHRFVFNNLRRIIMDSEISVTYTLYIPETTVIRTQAPLAEK